ncbi:MAG: HEAT repeat domain-containing protein [Proteobacteria bacterium]|nr:HEAT repeat domain-containing protein [Pseudomonadota bacterium]
MAADLQRHLDAIFEADRELRRLEALVVAREHSHAAAQLLTQAVRQASSLEDRRERVLRLERLADMCAQVPAAGMADTLIGILDSEDPSVRVHAADAIVDVAYERHLDVVRAIERALEAGGEGPAMAELPWVISEIGEANTVALIARFLSHRSGEVVASAVEALASFGAPEAIAPLEALMDDEREVTLDEPDSGTRVVISNLVRETIASLRGG